MPIKVEDFIGNLEAEELKELSVEFINNNPLGIILLSESFEVIFKNDLLDQFFRNQLRNDAVFLGNILNCEYVANSSDLCGTKRQCKSCKLRNSLKTAANYNKKLKNVQFSRTFIINYNKVTKWFNMTIIPTKIDEKKYLWLSLIDLTEFMKYKIQVEMSKILNYEENTLKNEIFHNEVMSLISKKAYQNDYVYFMYIKLNNLDDIRNTSGYLWKNEYISGFYYYLVEIMDQQDFICRCGDNDFLLFIPNKESVEIENFKTSLKGYERFIFNDKKHYEVVSVKILISDERVYLLNEEDTFHIEYFKLLSTIMNCNSHDLEIRF